MKSIQRKSLIYKTGVEYGDYTLNHVFGCSHGCKYPCYAYQMMKRFGKVVSYEDWIEPAIVENVMELLEKEIPKYKDKINMLHMCFSTDPFMLNQKIIIDTSIEILKKLNQSGISCSVLTKGILPQELSELNKKNEYGITLITLQEEYRKVVEPGASSILDRLEALKALKRKGCKTWISMEPYPTPNMIKQDLNEILEQVAFVDKIIFGRMHYNRQVSSFKGYKDFYDRCVVSVISFCEKNGIDYYIKKGTASNIDVKQKAKIS